jgi:hypothetical protein
VQREILEAKPQAELAVSAVRVPFLGGTRCGIHLTARASRPPVMQFWDDAALTSDWFAEQVEHSAAPAWDVYHLYGPDARWADVPAPFVSSGATIIARTSDLRAAIAPLLADAPAA